MGFDIYMYCQQNLSSFYWFTTPMADARPGSSAEWVGALTQNGWLYFLSETVVNNTLPKKLKNAWSKVKLLPNGLQISLDRLYCLTDKKYSSPKTRPYLSVFPPCFRLFCFPKLCLSICLGIWYLLVLPTSFIIILLIDSSTFTTASWSQGSVFSRKLNRWRYFACEHCFDVWGTPDRKKESGCTRIDNGPRLALKRLKFEGTKHIF